MLLALDAGNSNITIGAFEGRNLIGRWRLRTIHEQTADEWGVLMRNLFALASLDLAKVDGIIIASVVPMLDAPADRHGGALFPHHAVVHHSRHGHWDQGAVRQSARSGRGPRGERRGGVSSLRRTRRGGGSRNHHQLRCRFGERRISGRHDLPGHRDVDQRLIRRKPRAFPWWISASRPG